jgi:hypothetical protein
MNKPRNSTGSNKAHTFKKFTPEKLANGKTTFPVATTELFGESRLGRGELVHAHFSASKPRGDQVQWRQQGVACHTPGPTAAAPFLSRYTVCTVLM